MSCDSSASTIDDKIQRVENAGIVTRRVTATIAVITLRVMHYDSALMNGFEDRLLKTRNTDGHRHSESDGYYETQTNGTSLFRSGRNSGDPVSKAAALVAGWCCLFYHLQNRRFHASRSCRRLAP